MQFVKSLTALAVLSPLLGFIMVFRRTIFARKSCAKSFANRIGHWTVAVFFALSIATPVAADVRIEVQNPRTIHIFGKILAQDFNRLDAMLEQMEKRRPLTDITVTLDSLGGAYFEGQRLGLLLHRKGIGTKIMPGATCFSACATIFFGGFDRKTGRPNRVAHEGARLGVHRFSPDPQSALRNRYAFAAARLYFADMGVSEKIWRMFEETPPEDMHIVTPSDMAESDITFVPASKADALSVAPNLASVARRAVLYDEDPSDPKGKQYLGSVIWRTEPIKATGNPKPDIAVRADIEIPDRKFKMTMAFRRNTDSSLPASHTAELTFILPQDFSSGGVGNVPGILMKSDEQEPSHCPHKIATDTSTSTITTTKVASCGMPLAGLAVKVTNGFFLVGLSNVDADRARNIQLLTERSWFDVPLVYANQGRATIAIEKGAPGERAFKNAFAVWDRTLPTDN